MSILRQFCKRALTLVDFISKDNKVALGSCGSFHFFIILMFFPFLTFSQHEFHRVRQNHFASNTTFVESYFNGGYVIATEFLDSSSGFQGMLISSYDACDSIKWNKSFISPSADNYISEMNVTKNNEVLVTGNYQYINGNIFLLKVDKDGNVVFFKQYGSSDYEYPYSIGELSSGGYFISGNTTDGVNKFANFIMITDETGQLIRTKSYFNIPIWGRAIATSDGGILNSTGNLQYKLDNKGDLIWAKNFEDKKGYYVSYPLEVSDGYVFCRYSNFNLFDSTSHLFKIDFNGNLTWEGEYFIGAYTQHVVEQNNGNLIVLCNNYSPLTSLSLAVLAEFNSNGKMIRTVTKNSPPDIQYRSYDMAGLKNGDIIIAGVEEGLVDPTSFMFYSKSSSSLDFGDCSFEEIHSPSNRAVISGRDTSVVPGNLIFSELDLTYISEDILSVEFTSCEVKFELKLDLGNDTTLCPGLSLDLTAPLGFSEYLWSTGETTHFKLVDTPGVYILTAGNGCQTISDTIEVNFFDEVVPQFSISHKNASPWIPVDFISLNDSVHSVFWDFSEDTSTKREFSYLFSRNGYFPVIYRITDLNGCINESSTFINLRHVSIYIPNSLTPDGDGINDDFSPIGFGIKSFRIRIYDRKGEMIFDEHNKSWKASSGQRPLPNGAYAYDITVIDDFNKESNYRGIVFLLK